MLALGEGALGNQDGRLRWVDADLASAGWLLSLAELQVDAVLSTTALHWLSAAELLRVYRELGALVRPGGVFLNGDNMSFGPELPTFQRLVHGARDLLWSDASFAARGIETSEAWWEALKQETSLAPLLAERERRYAAKERQASSPIFDATSRHCGTRASVRLGRSGRPAPTAFCWRCAERSYRRFRRVSVRASIERVSWWRAQAAGDHVPRN